MSNYTAEPLLVPNPSWGRQTYLGYLDLQVTMPILRQVSSSSEVALHWGLGRREGWSRRWGLGKEQAEFRDARQAGNA